MNDTLQQLIASQLSSLQNDMRSLMDMREDDKKDSNESRRKIHESQNAQGAMLLTLNHRMETLEKSVAADQPFIAQAKLMHAQMQGAGKLGSGLWSVGRWLMLAAASLVGWIIATRSEISAVLSAIWHWFSGR